MRTIDDVLARLRAEYLEMPGLRLTADQVQRLCGIERVMCQTVLNSLVDTKFLWMDSDRTYVRWRDGERRSHPRMAKAGPGPQHRALKAS